MFCAALLATLSSSGAAFANDHALVKSDALPAKVAVPFNLSRVNLLEGSLFADMEARNLDFMLNLDSTSLTCLFTTAAKIGDPKCTPYGHPRYFGHYLGHYLSATAMAAASTGNEAIKSKSAAIVDTLSQCQDVWTKKGAGYEGFLYPYERSSFDNLFDKAPSGNCQPVCVPFYVMHKTMAGLIDQYTMLGNFQAFEMVKKMASWVQAEVEAVLKKGGQKQWQAVLDTEWGGMNEALYNLYALTGDPNHLTTGKYFNHWQWTAPLAIGVDDLDASHGNVGGNHANTHIPEIIGSARGYEVTGNKTQKDIATNFFAIVTKNHSFATGGSNDHEHW